MGSKFDPKQYVSKLHPDAVKAHKFEAQLKTEKAKNRELLQRLADADQRWRDVLEIVDYPTPPKLRTKKRKGTRQASPIFMASDWHVEEEVTLDRTNGLNQFNLKIAKQRSQNFFDGVVWLTKFYKSSHNGERPFTLEKGVLWLGGDMITNYLHAENVETNLLGPVDAIRFVEELLIQGIDYILENCGFEQLVVVCNHGNHGRLTKKVRAKTSARNNLEYLMYHALAKAYRHDERVRFEIAESAHAYVQVEGHWVRFTHGDEWNYGGGVGGLSVPVLRGLQRMEKGSPHKVAFTVMGHFHQWLDLNVAVVNDCLIGFNEYALRKSFGYSPPKQGFLMVDSKRGKCVSTPIWVD